MSDKSTFPLPKSYTMLPQFNKIQQNQQDILQKISDFQDDLNNITQYIESQNNKQNNVITDAEILRIFLDEIQFGKYYDKLIDNGVEDIKTLALLNAEELTDKLYRLSRNCIDCQFIAIYQIEFYVDCIDCQEIASIAKTLAICTIDS
eukprot:478163_1